MTRIKHLLALALLAPVLAFAQMVPFNQCAITTQNLVAAGTATTGSACEIDVKDKGAVSVQVTGTYTGALSAQVTTNGTTWLTLGASTTFTRATTGATSTTIGSGVQDGFTASVTGYTRFRITGLAAMTGTATVSIRAVDLAGGGGSSGGGGGASTIADGADVVSGTTTDAAVGDANGTINSHVRQTAKYSSLIQSDTSRLTSSAGPKAPGAALATTAFMVGGTYNSGGVTLTNTQESGLQMDAAGNVKVAGSFASGAVASGAYAAGSFAAGAGVDGWDLTQGAKADAVCGTDTGTCGLISLVKKTNANLTILAGSNAQLPTALGPTTKSASLSVTGASDDPAALGIGGTADAAATAGGTGSISAKLRTLTGTIGTAGSGGTNVVTVQGNASGTPIPVTTTFGSTGADVTVAVTRPNDTAIYNANDVIGTSTGSTAALTFTALCPIASKPVMITSAELRIDATGLIAGEANYILYLYNVTPPSATVDNAGWDLPSGDRASFLGAVQLGTPVDMGSTLYVGVDGINKQILCPASQNIFAYLVTSGGYTPTALRVYNVTLHAVGL